MKIILILFTLDAMRLLLLVLRCWSLGENAMYIALISKFADTFTINFIGEEVPNLASPEYIADNKGSFALHKVLDQMI